MGKYFALETGISLYRMSGLNMKDLPIKSNHSLVGPNFTFFVPGEFVIQFPANGFEFDIKGGGFVFYGFNQKLNYGNSRQGNQDDGGMGRGQLTVLHLRTDLVTGVHAGVELNVDVTSQFGCVAGSELPGRCVGFAVDGKLFGRDARQCECHEECGV
ncbi:MAG: hypothetical protein WDO15_04235 [Bacteroidota bacterium]